MANTAARDAFMGPSSQSTTVVATKSQKPAASTQVTTGNNGRNSLQVNRDNIKTTSSHALHSAETLGSMFLTSMAEGYFGPDKLKMGGLDLRAVTGVGMQGYGIYKTLQGEKSGAHYLGFGNGITGSLLASMGRDAGSALRDRQQGKAAPAQGPAPTMNGAFQGEPMVIVPNEELGGWQQAQFQGWQQAPVQGWQQAPVMQGWQQAPVQGWQQALAPAMQGWQQAPMQGHPQAPVMQGWQQAPVMQGWQQAPVQGWQQAPVQGWQQAPAPTMQGYPPSAVQCWQPVPQAELQNARIPIQGEPTTALTVGGAVREVAPPTYYSLPDQPEQQVEGAPPRRQQRPHLEVVQPGLSGNAVMRLSPPAEQESPKMIMTSPASAPAGKPRRPSPEAEQELSGPLMRRHRRSFVNARLRESEDEAA